jgi:ribosomal protein S18 acetylase RimI-like enzyme
MSASSMFKDFRLRDYRRGDFEELSALWQLTGMGSPKRGDDEETILRSIGMGGKMLILEEISTGTMAGSSWMTFDGRRILLHHFGILPRYQGKKLSHMLIEGSLDFVKQKGFQVKLEVHRDNKTAVSLYKKYGFEQLGDFDVYIIRDISRL